MLAASTVRVREVAVSAGLIVDLRPRLAGNCGSGTACRDRRRRGPRPRRGLAGHHRPPGRAGRCGRLTRVKVVDPSFFNWPALPVALADTIVPDFPLANKSFNQSYAGNDL